MLTSNLLQIKKFSLIFKSFNQLFFKITLILDKFIFYFFIILLNCFNLDINFEKVLDI